MVIVSNEETELSLGKADVLAIPSNVIHPTTKEFLRSISIGSFLNVRAYAVIKMVLPFLQSIVLILLLI